jgi:hypothetical protein
VEHEELGREGSSVDICLILKKSKRDDCWGHGRGNQDPNRRRMNPEGRGVPSASGQDGFWLISEQGARSVRRGARFHGGQKSRVEDKLLITGQGGQCDGWRRLIDGRRSQGLGIGEKEEAPSQDSWGNLVERTDNGRRVSSLKRVDIRALMHNHRVAVRWSECQDHPKITPGNINSGIVVVLIHVVDVPGERGELKNPWTGWGSCASKSQRMGSIRINFFFYSGRCLRDRDPDDERKDGDAVSGNGRVGKGDCDRGQGTW